MGKTASPALRGLRGLRGYLDYLGSLESPAQKALRAKTGLLVQSALPVHRANPVRMSPNW